MTTALRNGVRKSEGMRFSALPWLVLSCCVALTLVGLSSSVALSGQTREQCDACCAQAGYDEYYLEQCKLKCFRNHDHCAGRAAKQAAPEPAAKEPDQEPAARPRQSEIRLAWPNPLNLVPGKEGEAAAQILAVNGISPQHPHYNAALADLQAVLVNFARSHPQGGKLPTTQLKGILRQLK